MPSVYARQKNEEGQWRYIHVNIGRGRRPVDLAGPFFVRLKRNGRTQWTPAGETLEEARKEVAKQEAAQQVRELAVRGGLVIEDGAANRLKTKIAEFLDETKANKAPKTYLAYANAMEFFESCKRLNVEDIRRDDMLAFKLHLRNACDLSERSVYNNFLYTMIFLKWCGVKPGVKKH